MKYQSIAILIFCASVAATVWAQSGDDKIDGGTPHFIAQFTGKHELGDSNIFQEGRNLGVNTTTPLATLDVEGTGIDGLIGSTSSTGRFATGVIGRTASTTGNGVVGEATAASGNNNGVFGRSASPNGIGVSGAATSTTGGVGVYGQSVGTTGAGGLFGGIGTGVFSQASGAPANALFAYASATSGDTVGVVGFIESPNGTAGQFVNHSGAGLILQGLSGTSKTQVFTLDASGNAFFAGNLSKSGGSFKIDHPLDPANKYLEHSFVESPDMMNIYNGVVVLDSKGEASVNLPEYFQALNSDFRYQLTAIGAPGPNLYVAEEISGNHFKVAGGKPRAKVSWQVTGVRQDAYAKAHRIKVEEDKPAQERGHYLHFPNYLAQPKKRLSDQTLPRQ